MIDPRANVFVVIPAYNEAAVLAGVLRDVSANYPNVVVVDDGSADDTYRTSCGLARWTLRHPVNRGQGAALQTGIEFALRQGAEYIVTFDADGQHQVEDIASLLAPLVAGECDVTLGSRFLEQASPLPFSRRLLLRAAVGFTNLVSPVRITDTHNGLRGFTRAAARAIRIRMDRMAHASEILDEIGRNRLRYREIPVHVRYTAYSLQKGQRVADAPRVVFHYLLGRALQ
jgi:glycosyltransferase involved in cell wall biosynthesis